MGRIDEAQSRVDTGRRLLGEHESAESTTWISMNQLEIDHARGEWDDAIRVARSTLATAERSGSAFDPVASRAWLAITLLGAGEHAAAITTLDAAIELSAGRAGLDAIF